jgi:hypothetical protein
MTPRSIPRHLDSDGLVPGGAGTLWGGPKEAMSNVILNVLLVFIFGLGVLGSALSTVIIQWLITH